MQYNNNQRSVMNLTYFSNLIKKLGIPILVVSIILILVLLIFFRFGIKENKIQPVEQTKIPTLATSDNKIIFDTTKLSEPPSIPHKMTVYHLNDAEKPKFNAQLISAKLNFANEHREINDPNLGKGVVYSNKEGALLIYSQSIIYQKIAPANTINAQDINLLKEKAKNFLNDINLDTTIIDQAKITYEKVSGEDLHETQDKSQAQFITLNFPQTISNLPLVGPFETNKISFDADGSVLRFIYLETPNTQPLNNYPIITFQKAIENLKLGKGSLISAESEYEDTRIHGQISNANLGNSYLAYYFPTVDASTIQPVWVFEGTGSIENTVFEVTFVLPAIEEKYFTPTTKP